VTAALTGTLTSRFAGVGGLPFKAFVSTLVANAARVELDGLQVSPGGRSDVELWSKARSSFVFHQQALNGLRFRSERSGQDAVAIRGGEQRNFWDLPRRSDARPFPFTGSIDTFGLIADADGAVLTSLAQTPHANDVCGLAIENLYVVVRPPKRCALAAAFEPASSAAPGGFARLFLDARFGVPMLPDPYASNIGVVDPGDTFAELLHLDLSWIWSQPPAVRAHLDGDLRLAASASADAQQSGDLAIGMFRRTIDPFRRIPAVETMFLLDLSSREDLYGVAFEPLLPQPALPNEPPSIADNQFTVPLNRVRLFMQPQVHWEPLWVQASPNVPQLAEGMVHSVLDSGLTLVGVGAVTTTVPAVPAIVTRRILEAIGDRQPAAAVFALPFGLRATADLTRRPIERPADLALPSTQTSIHEPDFGRLHGARQIRLEARQLRIGIVNAADPVMPGMLQQLENLDRAPIQNPPPAPPAPKSVLSELTPTLNGAFGNTLPLRQADLSGYGLSTFSEWSRDTPSGVTKVHFHVLNGRTAYEVIQVRSRLYECTAPVVRTITMARHNAASVVLTDSGWVPVADGEFAAVDKAGGGTAPFANGVVRAYRRIRRITTTGSIVSIPAAGGVPAARFETVVFDADLEIDTKDGQTVTVPLLGRTGYVHLPDTGKPLLAEQLRSLFQGVGVITSPTNAALRIAKTLALHATSVAADAAPDDAQGVGFGVALVGNPQLPRAGQWSVVKLDQATSAGLPIDQHRGVPIVQLGGGDVVFREPSEARRTSAIVRYALMMSTPTSRALFPQPAVRPAAAGRLFCDRPSLADPYSLVQASGVFPAANAALGLKTAASFAIAGDDWKIEQGPFTFDPPAGNLLDGGGWSIGRLYPGGTVNLALDSAANALWKVAAPPSDLNLRLPDPLGDILTITTEYLADSSGLPRLTKPKVDFLGPLNEVRDIIDALGHIVDTGFDVDVSVTADGSAVSPAFRVQLKMLLRIGSPEERIDIGVGKFFGQFILGGDLAIGAAGVSDPRLSLQFQGDVQQGIIPPLLYAGGLFRFGVTIPATGAPVIELALGVVASIGGDLIKGLLEVEVTVHYGYVLIPETLQPGVLLGLDARAKLLSGLVGFSFGVEAMGRIQRLSKDGVRVWAHIRVAATVQIAWLIEEDVDFETEFEQEIPLAIATLAAGGGLALAGLAAAVES
jgi:hypothetical protein